MSADQDLKKYIDRMKSKSVKDKESEKRYQDSKREIEDMIKKINKGK
jgi:hypothetical protein